MTRFRVHLCATPWTAGQARRRRVRVIPSAVIDRFWSDWKRNRAPKTHTHTQLTVGMNEWSPPLLPSTNAASSVRRARRFLLFTRAHQSVPAEQVDQTWIWVKEQPTRLDLAPNRKACRRHYRGFARIYGYNTTWDVTAMILRRLSAKDGCRPDFKPPIIFMYIV